jgi:prepilin-type N-terminal cleavage/methylation domain-containing protein
MVGRRGFSLIEVVVVSAVFVTTLFLVFQMIGHFTIWYRRLEARADRNAGARYVIHRVSDLLSMAGYRASVAGVHSIGADGVTVECLVEGAEEEPGRYSRHRLYTIRRDGSRVNLTTRRRRLPLDGTPAWGEGSTSVLIDEARDVRFEYLDEGGRQTDVPKEVRVVKFSFRLGPEGGRDPREPDRCFQAAVYLRNHHG